MLFPLPPTLSGKGTNVWTLTPVNSNDPSDLKLEVELSFPPRREQNVGNSLFSDHCDWSRRSSGIMLIIFIPWNAALSNNVPHDQSRCPVAEEFL